MSQILQHAKEKHHDVFSSVVDFFKVQLAITVSLTICSQTLVPANTFNNKSFFALHIAA